MSSYHHVIYNEVHEMQATMKFKKFELHDYATRHSELMLWGWDSQQTPWRQGQK